MELYTARASAFNGALPAASSTFMAHAYSTTVEIDNESEKTCLALLRIKVSPELPLITLASLSPFATPLNTLFAKSGQSRESARYLDSPTPSLNNFKL